VTPQTPADAEFHRLRRRLRLAVGALVFVTLVGILGFTIIGRGQHGLIDAVYMTVITLTTVGFGEIIDMSANPAGRVFTTVLLLVGMGIVAYTVPMLAAFFIEGQLRHIFARRRMQKNIEQLTGHFIVCGDTPASRYVAHELLRTGRPVVFIAPAESALDAEEAARMPVVTGDPSDDSVLQSAGISRAGGIVLGMRADGDNVLGVLSARRLAPNARIIAATDHTETEPKLRMAGADAVVSPSRIGGLRMASELVRPHVVTFLDQMLRETGGSLRVEEVAIPDGPDLRAPTLAASGLDQVSGCVLLAIRRADGSFQFNPPRDAVLEAGVTLIVMTDAEGRRRLVAAVEKLSGAG
jgi:voltage-gated potassium channel